MGLSVSEMLQGRETYPGLIHLRTTLEEITAQFVVIRTTDERRLIYPLTQFTGNHFQNWTRTKREKLAIVTLSMKLTTDLQALRRQFVDLLRICQDWNGRVSHVQVRARGWGKRSLIPMRA